MKLALAFPGVGAALTGREVGVLQRNRDVAAPLLDRASAVAGHDLEAALGAGDLSALPEVAVQLLTYAHGCAMARALVHRGHRPVAAAGYSMGLYAALECAGVVSFDDGLTVTAEAHRVMLEVCGGGGPHGLAVTVGLTRRDLEQILAQDEELARVRLVNENNATALVSAGPVAALDLLVARALAADAIKAARLDADLPYHHPELMAAAPAAFEQALRRIRFHQAAFPVVSAVTGELLRHPAQLRQLTAGHLARPLCWPAALDALAGLGVDAAVECGPGISLTQSARMVAGAPRFYNVKTVQRRLEV